MAWRSFIQFLTGSVCAVLTAVLYVEMVGRLNTLLGFTFPLYDYLRFYPPSVQAGFWSEVLGCPLAVTAGAVFGVWLGRAKKLVPDDEMDPRARRRWA
jgi:hypothetical protein